MKSFKKESVVAVISPLFILALIAVIVFIGRNNTISTNKSGHLTKNSENTLNDISNKDNNIPNTNNVNTSDTNNDASRGSKADTEIFKEIRESEYSKTFYPSDFDELNKELSQYFSNTKKLEKPGKPRVVIAPHAGIKYSGQTAAWAFKQFEKSEIKNFIVVGINHKEAFQHAAVYNGDAWQTPYGNIPINKELVTRLLSGNIIKADKLAHSQDHSIELEILFLAKLFDLPQTNTKTDQVNLATSASSDTTQISSITVVPIILAQPTDSIVNHLAFKIASLLDDKTALIISSDFSHYPSYDDANLADKSVINAILTGKMAVFEKAVQEVKAKNYPNLSTSACGYNPIRVALRIAEILNFTDIQLINYANSGDITKDKSSVVGYGAIGMWSENIPPIKISEAGKIEALKIARKTLEDHYANEFKSYSPINEDLRNPIGAFVTLTKNDVLRGCIGQFEPSDPLIKTIQNVAISAATKDTRFKPVTQDELKDISIEISTMSPLKKINDWREINLGVNGVKIVQGNKTGTFLPQVSTENNWNLETFLNNLCSQKANLPKDCYTNPQTQIYTFETEIFSEDELIKPN